jgi:Flp pilus assembly protein TadD
MDQSPAQAFELALKHFLAGQPQQAAAICTRILAAHPNHPDALHLLGAVALGEGRFGPAVTYFQSAIAGYTSTDDLAEAYSNLGIAFMGLQNLKDSIAAHRKSLALRPDSAESNNNLGFALKMAGNEAEAEAAVRRALAIRPLYPSAIISAISFMLAASTPRPSRPLSAVWRPTRNRLRSIGTCPCYFYF